MKSDFPDLLVMLSGFTSTLDKRIVEELNAKNIPVKILVRNLAGVQEFRTKTSILVETKANHPRTFKGHLEGIHTVISTLSVSSGKNTIFDTCIGYNENMELLEEAQKSGVKKFIYVADVNSHLHKDPKVLEEKHKFITQLEVSGIDYTILNHS